MQTTTINPENFILGESESDKVANRGFSPASKGLNLTKERGTVYFQPSATDRGGATLVDDIIASTYDKQILGNDIYYLDDSGNFYTLDGGTFTKRQTDSTNTYIDGTSDLVVYKGANLYATSTTDIALLTNTDLTTIDHDWWTNTRSHTSLSSSYRHPMEVVEDTLYIADRYYIHTWDGTTSVQQAMSLPQDVNITSLRRHPDGRHLIAFCGITANYSHLKGGGGRIYLIDTVNLEWTREIITESQVEGSQNQGGVVYITYGDNLGYFNGDGIEHLHKLSTKPVYSHKLAGLEDILLVADGSTLLAYGDLGSGNVFWRLFTAGSNVTNVAYKGDNKITVAYNDSGVVLKELDYDDAGVTGQLVNNRLNFGSNVWIRRIVIEHTETDGAGTSAFNVKQRDLAGGVTTIKNVSYSSLTVRETRIDTNILTRDLQLYIEPDTDALGFRRITIYYESGE